MRSWFSSFMRRQKFILETRKDRFEKYVVVENCEHENCPWLKAVPDEKSLEKKCVGCRKTVSRGRSQEEVNKSREAEEPVMIEYKDDSEGEAVPTYQKHKIRDSSDEEVDLEMGLFD